MICNIPFDPTVWAAERQTAQSIREDGPDIMERIAAAIPGSRTKAEIGAIHHILADHAEALVLLLAPAIQGAQSVPPPE